MSSRKPTRGSVVKENGTPPNLAEATEAIEKAEARHQALALAKDLAQSGKAFHLPASPFDGEGLLIQDLRTHASGIGVFAARKDWFEALDLENWIRSLCRRAQVNPVFLYPRAENSFEMSFRVCTKDQLEESSQFAGILEASKEAPKQVPSLVFVPCSMADTQGHRMGRGRGFYDRYLAQHSQTKRVGVVHSRFLKQSFPDSWVQSHDQNMDALLTQQQFFKLFKPMIKETTL
jgi:5,10-methenyltetrahydrofolate synthetase